MGCVAGDVTSVARATRDERDGSVRPARPCPVCASTDHELLYEQRFESFAAGSITDAYDVVACCSCGMCFAAGLPDARRFADYYGQSSKYDLSAENAEISTFEADRYAGEAEFIAASVADRSVPVLDIGTATGPLLIALQDHGFSNVHGIEPSADAARKAREVHGLDVREGDAGSATSWGLEFGVVTLVAVLEHLIDPVEALRSTAELLRTDGILYLLVPDASRFENHVDAPYQEFSVEHINYFTPPSFRNLIGVAGLQVVRERQTVLTISDDSTSPAIEVLCRRSDAPSTVSADRQGVEALRRYVSRSEEKEGGLLARISEMAIDQRPIYVWGTGTNALHLLAASRLGDCNIIAFLDSNPHYAGQQLAGRPVMGPHQLTNVDAPILVASAISQTAIVSAARARYGLDVPLILLY